MGVWRKAVPVFFFFFLVQSMSAIAAVERPDFMSGEEMGEMICRNHGGRRFAGCRPNASECRYSCPRKGMLVLEDPTGWICDAYNPYEAVLCCCGEGADSES